MGVDKNMSKEALIAELEQARCRIKKLEELERSHTALESALRPLRVEFFVVIVSTAALAGLGI